MARKSEGLSDRHRRIMEFLTRFEENYHYSPSIREVGDSIDVKSTSLVDYYLDQLQEKKYIERDKRISRSIRVLIRVYPGDTIPGQMARMVRRAGDALNELVSLPLLGRIVAGKPIPVPESDVSYFDEFTSIEIARSSLPTREKLSDLFALEVQGDSMIDAMVNDGDIIILKKAQEANNGDMVAVWRDDTNETTLKYFFKEGDQVRLQPANPTMTPIIIKHPENLRIMGKVVMVIRQVQTASG